MARPAMGGMKAGRVPLQVGPFAKLTPGGNLTRGSVRVQAVILNAPEVNAALGRIAFALRGPLAAAAATAGGEEIRKEWSRVALTANTTGRGEGNYSRSIQVRKATTREDPALNVAGASVYVYPGTVPGVPEDEQPRRYAPVLEFGGQLSKDQHSSYIPANPVARTAFMASYMDAVDAAGDALRVGLTSMGAIP